MNDKLVRKYLYYNEAIKIWLGEVYLPWQTEVLPLRESLSRMTAKAVKARVSNPFYQQAALDGIAVASKDTYLARDTNPLKLRQGKDALWVNTGDPLPPSVDAVIPLEQIISQNEAYFEIYKSVNQGEAIRQIGEDFFEGQLLLVSGELLRPQHLGLLALAGIDKVEVVKKLKVGIITTGEELVSPDQKILETGQVIDANTPMLSALLDSWGAIPVIYPNIPNEEKKIIEIIKQATQEVDILLVIAGSSRGSKDLVPDCLQQLGKILVKGVAIKPGRPVVLAKINQQPVINIPGYPVSAYLTTCLFIKPLIDRYMSGNLVVPDKIRAILTRKVFKEVGVREYLRVALTLRENDNQFLAYTLPRGAGVLNGLKQADGWLVLPENSEGYAEGTQVEVEMLETTFKDGNLAGNLVIPGSHDLALDILSSFYSRFSFGKLVKLFPLGSLSGYNLFKNGFAELCGMHILDEETGEYNLHLLKELKVKARLVNLAFREQGLIVQKNNPLNIRKVENLCLPGIIFVNRQRGAGTRILLDFLLKQIGLPAEMINGYVEEEFTHFGVAKRIQQGLADTGMGIKAVSDMYGLDFIPLKRERYDLLMTEEFYHSEKGNIIMNILKSEVFRQEVLSLGGYHTDKTAEVIWQSP